MESFAAVESGSLRKANPIRSSPPPPILLLLQLLFVFAILPIIIGDEKQTNCTTDWIKLCSSQQNFQVDVLLVVWAERRCAFFVLFDQ